MTTTKDRTMSGLPHLCADLLSFAVRLRRASDPGSFEELRSKLNGLFTDLDSRAREALIDAADVQLARYALAALIDEIVLGSNWPVREEWTKRPLQLEYFNEFTAGQGVYNRLTSLRGTTDPAKLDVLEVYALCLGLGFKGKHSGLSGAEQIKALMSELSREIRLGKHQEAEGLSPTLQTRESLPEGVRRLPVWIVAAIGAGVLLLLFLLFVSLLGMKGLPVQPGA